MILVVDASVAIKWFLHFRPDEAHVEQALAILAQMDSGGIKMIQPPHFVAEVASVLAREKPNEALSDLRNLLNLEFEITANSAIYATATELSIRLRHHLFDTLYHATALHTPDALCVTADQRYFEKARDLGYIALLAELDLPT